jgi:HSP20 family protein
MAVEKTLVPPKKSEAALTARRPLPLGLFDELRAEMEELWDRPFPYLLQPFGRTLRRMGRATTWSPRLDVFEKEGELIVRADLPGLKKNEIEVTFEENDLILHGEHKEETEVKQEDFYRMERAYGAFYRRMPLPFSADPGLVVAKFADGVLEVKIPIPVEKQVETKKIAVS